VDTQPFTGQRADNNKKQGKEKDIDPEALALRFDPADQRPDEKPRCQPCSSNPEQA
jgi:hypothetical protein